jgi:hypothetical protein
MTKEIIIASYKENLNWVEDIPRDWIVSIYNTDKDRTNFPFNKQYLQKLPNIGREAGQWLHHIVDRYDKLADFSFFCQGDKAHDPKLIDQLLHAEELPPHPFAYLGTDGKPFTLPMVPFEPVKQLLRLGWQDEAIPMPRPFRVGAQFYATKETIHNRPKEHYERILDGIHKEYPPHWSAAHLLEPAWGCVFKIKENQ